MSFDFKIPLNSRVKYKQNIYIVKCHTIRTGVPTYTIQEYVTFGGKTLDGIAEEELTVI